MVTISVVDYVTKQEQDCFSFECVCNRDSDSGIVDYLIYGYFMSNSYFRLDKCPVFYSTDVNAAMDKLEELDSQLAEAKQIEEVSAKLADTLLFDGKGVIL